jgi:hypothetical protein
MIADKIKNARTILYYITTLSATCRLPVYEIMKTDCESLATCNRTRYNEEKRGGDIYGKNSKCICTC